MKRRLTPNAVEAYIDAPSAVRKAFAKQVKMLVLNLRHPSLHAKKYDETGNIWQARVNQSWRFYFTIEMDTYVILDIIPHPKK